MTGLTYGSDTYGSGTYGGLAAAVEPTWIVHYLDPVDGWADMTCDVRHIKVVAGRSTYVDAFDAASLELELANFAGIYSTWTRDSIWKQASGFVTDVPVRAGVVLAGAVEWRFTGTTDAVFDSWPGTTDALATVAASDGFKALARFNGGPRAASGAGELSGARIGRLATDARWSGPRRLDAGTVALQATTLDGVTLDLMRQVGESEWGWLYIAGDGALVFLQRDAGDTRPNMTTVQWTFTDDDALAGVCYGDAVVASDESHIINIAAVTPTGHATTSRFENAASSAWFGPKSWTRTDLPINADTDALGLAQLVVAYYGADDQRIDALTFDGIGRPHNWATAAGVDITDRVRWVRTFPGGDQVDTELLVLGRTDDVLPAGGGGRTGQWSIRLATASALTTADLGYWDDADAAAGWDLSQWGV